MQYNITVGYVYLEKITMHEYQVQNIGKRMLIKQTYMLIKLFIIKVLKHQLNSDYI